MAGESPWVGRGYHDWSPLMEALSFSSSRGPLKYMSGLSPYGGGVAWRGVVAAVVVAWRA